MNTSGNRQSGGAARPAGASPVTHPEMCSCPGWTAGWGCGLCSGQSGWSCSRRTERAAGMSGSGEARPSWVLPKGSGVVWILPPVGGTETTERRRRWINEETMIIFLLKPPPPAPSNHSSLSANKLNILMKHVIVFILLPPEQLWTQTLCIRTYFWSTRSLWELFLKTFCSPAE